MSILLIDSANILFDIFFKMQNRKVMLGKNVDVESETFFAEYSNQVVFTIKRLKYKYNIPFRNIYFVRDSPNENNWRRVHYPEYKKKYRDVKCKNRLYNLYNLFNKIYEDVIPKMAEQYNFNIIQIMTAEADDIIAVITNMTDPTIGLYIISSDSDYLQLLSRMNTYIYNIDGEFINDKLNGMTPMEKLLYKILCGDRSDNISACINYNNVDEYIGDPLKLLKLFKNDSKLLDKFSLNRLMIDFRCIPINIQTKIMETFVSIKTANDSS